MWMVLKPQLSERAVEWSSPEDTGDDVESE